MNTKKTESSNSKKTGIPRLSMLLLSTLGIFVLALMLVYYSTQAYWIALSIWPELGYQYNESVVDEEEESELEQEDTEEELENEGNNEEIPEETEETPEEEEVEELPSMFLPDTFKAVKSIPAGQNTFDVYYWSFDEEPSLYVTFNFPKAVQLGKEERGLNFKLSDDAYMLIAPTHMMLPVDVEVLSTVPSINGGNLYRVSESHADKQGFRHSYYSNEVKIKGGTNCGGSEDDIQYAPCAEGPVVLNETYTTVICLFRDGGGTDCDNAMKSYRVRSN